MDRLPLVVIAGPTASGKTALSLEIASHFDGEIISADSMQIYRLMDIGTAKPTLAERRGIAHHLIDEVMPDEEFHVARYAELARRYIADIHARGALPILVGGTGLYIDTVVEGVRLGEAGIDEGLRERLRNIAREKGNGHLHAMLAEVDPEAAGRLHQNDLKRVIRALEVYHLSGCPISEHQRRSREGRSPYTTMMFLPEWDRAALYRRIDDRVDAMVEAGLYDEVKMLLGRGYTKALTSMQAIGYKEMLDYHYGYSTWDETVEIIKRSSRRYAKRQLTWLRRNENYIRLPAPDGAMADKCIAMISQWLEGCASKIG